MKSLADFKKQLKTRITIMVVLGIAALILLVLVGINGYQKSAGSDGHVFASVLGANFGFLGGFLGAAFVKLAGWTRAMKDETLLKKLYVKETDERSIYIRDKMGSLGFTFNLAALILATAISSFFSVTVFVTLAAVLLATLAIYACIAIYCYRVF